MSDDATRRAADEPATERAGVTGVADEAAEPDLAVLLDHHRRELTAHCYRILGGALEPDDAVQETLLRAWRSYDRFEGRSSLRSWLYRIATNVCFDQLKASRRLERPVGLAAAQAWDLDGLAAGLPVDRRPGPVADDAVLPREGDPADVAVGHESIRLAFVAVLRHLPPRQRAVLLLREVLRWSAVEVATLLDTSVVSVNSALQRARATLENKARTPQGTGATASDEVDHDLLARYVDAFERYDVRALVILLHQEASAHLAVAAG